MNFAHLKSRDAPLESSTTAATFLLGYAERDHSGHRPLLGVSRFGGAFGYNPFELYAAQLVSGPNAFVFGKIGKGKSSLVKSYLARMFAHGYPSVIIDPKGEYHALSRYFGFEPVSFVTENSGVNPFVSPGSGDGALARELNRELAELAVAFACKRPLSGMETTALAEALVRCGEDLSFARMRRELIALDRNGGPGEWLGGYVRGDLANVVAGCGSLLDSGLVSRSSGGSIASVLYQGILVVDLSLVFGTALYSLAVTLVLSAIRAVQLRSGACPVVVAIDEVWALTQDREALRWLQRYWKLSRSLGIANLAVTHRLGDLSAFQPTSDDPASMGLIADSETFVAFAMDAAEAARFCSQFGLAPEVGEAISKLGRGSALWKFGSALCLVDHHLTSTELAICDTDAAMRVRRSSFLATSPE